MPNELITSNQRAKLALEKAKNLINITGNIRANDVEKNLLESWKKIKLSVRNDNTNRVTFLLVTPDENQIVSGSSDETIRLWDLKRGQVIRIFKGYNSWIASIAITPDGKYIVSGSLDNTLKLWEISSGKEVRTFEGHSSSVNSVAITPDGKYIVSGSGDDTLKLWEISSGKEIRTFEGHSSTVYTVAITPDGKYIVSGSQDDTLKLWEISSGKEIRTFEGQGGSVAITPNGKRVVSNGGSSIKLWDLQTGTEIRTMKIYSEGWASSLAITPDGEQIICGSLNGVDDCYGPDCVIKLWDLQSGSEIRTLKGHNDEITSIAITPDGKKIVSGASPEGFDNMIKLWNLDNGNLITSYVSYTDGEWIAWTPAGEYNCSEGAYKHFCFVDDSKEIPEIIDASHPIYKQKKKDILIQELK